MKRALVLLLLAGCLDFNQGLKDCYVDGACHDAGAAGGVATGGGSTGGGATGGGNAGGAAGGSAGGAAGGTAGGAAGGSAGGTTGWTTLPTPPAGGGALNLVGISQLPDGTLVTANDLDSTWRLVGSWLLIPGSRAAAFAASPATATRSTPTAPSATPTASTERPRAGLRSA